jgi:hypothetical protein
VGGLVEAYLVGVAGELCGRVARGEAVRVTLGDGLWIELRHQLRERGVPFRARECEGFDWLMVEPSEDGPADLPPAVPVH